MNHGKSPRERFEMSKAKAESAFYFKTSNREPIDLAVHYKEDSFNQEQIYSRKWQIKLCKSLKKL